MKLLFDKSQIIILFISLALLVSNGLLIWQNINLKSQLKNQIALLETQEGDQIEKLRYKDLNNNEGEIEFAKDDRKQILLYFRTTCSFCKKQMNYWKNLVAKIDTAKFRISAITIEDDQAVVNDYIKSYNIENWDVLTVNAEDAKKAKFSATPITVVVNNQGKVEKVWIGMWRDSELKSVGEYFTVDFTNIKSES